MSVAALGKIEETLVKFDGEPFFLSAIWHVTEVKEQFPLQFGSKSKVSLKEREREIICGFAVMLNFLADGHSICANY